MSGFGVREAGAGGGVTRLAPSPTGALHLGNARTFLVNWAMARRRGQRIILRIEDLDGPRNKPGAQEQAVETLRWLGLDWDEGPMVQSADLSPYRAALARLAAAGVAYPCELTRGEIEAAASAPNAGEEAGEVRFPRELRPALLARRVENEQTNWRFATPDDEVSFVDEFAGPQRLSPGASVGDFVIWTKRGQPSYQLAVVVDDDRQGVTDVVRGDDLLDSAARQLLLYRALGMAGPARFCHLPLVVGPDGRRLAKRHGDTRVDRYRGEGVAAERVIGLLAWWSGVGEAGRAEPRAMTAHEFAEGFELTRMPRERIVFRAEDDAWLLAG